MLIKPLSDCWIIAHRGARDEAPENTRTAFERALAYPIDGIELDVQLSADGQLVIYHDWTLRRIGGSGRRLSRHSVSELTRLDWGAWFGPAYTGEPLPLLEPLLAELGPRTRWLIEIKAHPADKADGRAFELTSKLMALLDKLKGRIPEDAMHVLGFDADLLSYAAGLRPGGRFVLNLSEKTANTIVNAHVATDHLWAVDLPIARLCPALVQWAGRRGLKVLTYTCNGLRQVHKASALGVDGLITDRPGWLAGMWGRSPEAPERD